MSVKVDRAGWDDEIRASELMADISLLPLGPGDSCRMTTIPIQDGMDLLIWNGCFQEPMHLAMLDDSNRVHFTYVLRGHAHCELHRHCGCDVHEVGEGAGIIHFGPDRRGRYSQQGEYASVTVMIRPDVLAGLGGELDGGLRSAVDLGQCFFGGCRGAELHATAQSLSASVHLPGVAASRASARNRLWLEGQGLSLVGLFLESRLDCTGDPSISPADRTRLCRARDMLLADLGRAPSLGELAESNGLSLLKLKRGFRALFGHSVYGLFMRERMHEARRRLLLGGASVTEVATDLGYTNLSHFAAAFRKQFGVAPAAIRGRA